MTDRRAELEAAIDRDPYDTTAYAILGDFLQQIGDPRGELIALQIAAVEHPIAEVAANTYLYDRADEFTAGLPTKLRRSNAGRVVWRNGFIHKAVAADLELRELLAHASARFLVDLAIDHGASFDVVVCTLVESPVATLRILSLGCHTQQDLGTLDDLWPAVARLRQLFIHGDPTFAAIALPELERLAISVRELRSETVEALARTGWPVLRELALRTAAGRTSTRQLAALLAGTAMPNLVSLALNYPDLDQLIEPLAAGSIARGLRSLDVSNIGYSVPQQHRLLTDAGARLIARHASAFPMLDVLDVSGNRLTSVGLAALAGIATTLRADHQRNDDDIADERDWDLYDY